MKKYLAILISFFFLPVTEAAEFKVLSRPDLGLEYTVPVYFTVKDIGKIYSMMEAQKEKKSYQKNKYIPQLDRIVPNIPVERVRGDLTLYNLSRPEEGPLTGPGLNCSEVKQRHRQALEILSVIDQLIEEIEEIAELMNQSSFEIEEIEQWIAELGVYSDSIQSLWHELNQVYPESLSREKYELVYAWSYTHPQACNPRYTTLRDPVVEELAMPGAYWHRTQGGSVTDFYGVLAEPGLNGSQFYFRKEVTLPSACLDDQSVQILARTATESLPNCSLAASSGHILLEAGFKDSDYEPHLHVYGRHRPVACSRLVADFKHWLSFQSPSQVQAISFNMTSNKIRTKAATQRGPAAAHAGFAQGYLYSEGSDLVAVTKKRFGDRLSSPKKDPFDRNRPDEIELRLRANGSSNIKLISWGNVDLPLRNVQCHRDLFGDYLRGEIREGNGTSIVHIGFHKERKRFWNHFDVIIHPFN